MKTAEDVISAIPDTVFGYVDAVAPTDTSGFTVSIIGDSSLEKTQTSLAITEASACLPQGIRYLLDAIGYSVLIDETVAKLFWRFQGREAPEFEDKPATTYWSGGLDPIEALPLIVRPTTWVGVNHPLKVQFGFYHQVGHVLNKIAGQPTDHPAVQKAHALDVNAFAMPGKKHIDPAGNTKTLVDWVLLADCDDKSQMNLSRMRCFMFLFERFFYDPKNFPKAMTWFPMMGVFTLGLIQEMDRVGHQINTARREGAQLVLKGSR